MYKPYQKPVNTAFPDVKVAKPKISKLFIIIVTLLSKAYIHILFGFVKILLNGDDILFDVFKRALAKESRCIIAFRHPDGREPQLLSWFFLFRLKKYAAKKKIRFALRPHSIFVYGYEVARWGGWFARLFMPNLGAIPIHHTKVDSEGMARIYNSIVDGPYPLSLAPEGQVSYSTDTVPHLEFGVVRIGFHAAELLAEKDSNCPLEILPLSIHFRYDKWGKASMEKLLRKIEKFCGFRNNNVNLSFEERLRCCRDYILSINEKRYDLQIDESSSNEPGSFEDRLEKVVYAALETAERMLYQCWDTKAEGDFFARLYKVRHECWDNIFLPSYDNFKKLSPIKRSVLDLKAGNAWHIARHQEMADFAWYFRCPLPTEETPLNLKVEYVQNLWDFANRTMGGALSGRVNIKPAKVIIKTAPVINLTERLSQYKEDKKTAVADTMNLLEQAYLNCIEEIKEVYY